MNTRKLLVITAIVASTVTPAISIADDTAALNACIKTFVDKNLATGQPVRVRPPSKVTAALTPQTVPSEFIITAKYSASGRMLAKRYCTVDAKGTVIAMSDYPTSIRLSRR